MSERSCWRWFWSCPHWALSLSMSYPEVDTRTVCTSEKKLSRKATTIRPMAALLRRGHRPDRRSLPAELLLAGADGAGVYFRVRHRQTQRPVGTAPEPAPTGPF